RVLVRAAADPERLVPAAQPRRPHPRAVPGRRRHPPRGRRARGDQLGQGDRAPHRRRPRAGDVSAATGGDAASRARAVLARGSRSFALAGRLLGEEERDRAAIVYAFCRRADDAVDRAPAGEAAAAVARLCRELHDLYAGRPTGDAVLDAFGEVARACGIPQSYPAELLAGMEMDATGARY